MNADEATKQKTWELLTVEEAAKALKIGRTRFFQLLHDGEVESILIGNMRRIPTEALRRYVDKKLGAPVEVQPPWH